MASLPEGRVPHGSFWARLSLLPPEQLAARAAQEPAKWLCLLTHLYHDKLRSEAEVISHLSKLENALTSGEVNTFHHFTCVSCSNISAIISRQQVQFSSVEAAAIWIETSTRAKLHICSCNYTVGTRFFL